jgi:hypothetical protein
MAINHATGNKGEQSGGDRDCGDHFARTLPKLCPNYSINAQDSQIEPIQETKRNFFTTNV